jgi:hypothetical protein
MKLFTITALVLAATASVTSMPAAAEPPKTTGQQANEASATRVQPHSHLQEKTGIMPQKKMAKTAPEKEPDASSTTKEEADSAQKSKPAPAKGKVRADKDQSRHYHPRDGK